MFALGIVQCLVLVLGALTSAATFRITIYAPGTIIDSADLDASGNAFYTGLTGPSTYCPSQIGRRCPAPQGTLVYQGMTGMAVEVPGGQRIYVDPSGRVAYTQAHSAYMPQGSLVGGWYNRTVVLSCGTPVGVIDFAARNRTVGAGGGGGGGGVLLCPDVPDDMEGSGASYQLYAVTPRFNATNCVRALGLLLHQAEAQFGCWQYA